MHTMPDRDACGGAVSDVVVVGFGPVGATLAVLLAQHGWRVTALDRWPEPYSLPRATSVDGLAARLLAGAGIGPALREIGEPANGYDWRNAAGDTLLRIPLHQVGRYGWPDATTLHQPTLEAAIAKRAADLPNLTVLRGHTVTSIENGAETSGPVRVVASTTDQDRIDLTTRWVVGCDGANSFVREHVRAAETDLGFSYDWLLCDVMLQRPREFRPTNVQLCDPARPTTMVGSGPGRRRFEFMRMPAETIEWLSLTSTAWRLLSRFDVTPTSATLLRHATYTFRSKWVTQWRTGRVLLAGDAAHLMPPFAGQGMCTGLQDVANLSWKLDLVLRGVALPALLDTYGAERVEQAEQAIWGSVKLGRVICVADPAAARDRDAAMLARARTAPAGPEPAGALTSGLLQRTGTGEVASGAGEVFPQGRVIRLGPDGDHSGLFDDVVGGGFILVTAGAQGEWLSDSDRSLLDAIGTHVVRIVPSASAEPGRPGIETVVDLDDVYLPYLAAIGRRAVLVRPDHHVFGRAGDTGELSDLVGQLRRGLSLTDAAPLVSPPGADERCQRETLRRSRP
jgi:flavoprotein hydroxylase